MTGTTNHDPRSVYPEGAAYSFGIRRGKWRDDCSPGPCYYLNSKVYRNGLDGTPHYSLYGRQKNAKCFPVPGPGAYSPEKAGPCSMKLAPAYSFGARHRHRKTDNIPASNCYTLPSVLGKTKQGGKRQAPCYSLTGRSKTGSFHEDLQKTPGPGAYNTVDPNCYKNKSAEHSMTSRNIMPGDGTQKPGPGAHSPEKSWKHTQHSPMFSFGIRHSEYLAPLVQDCHD